MKAQKEKVVNLYWITNQASKLQKKNECGSKESLLYLKMELKNEKQNQ